DFNSDTMRVHSSEVKLWDVITGKERSPLPVSQGPVHCVVAFSPNGKLLAAAQGEANGEPMDIQLWDTATHKEIATLKGNDGENMVAVLAFSPDSKTLAVGTVGRVVTLWDLHGDKPPCRLPFESYGSYSCLAFAPDGQTLAVAAVRNRQGMVILWDVPAAKERAVITEVTSCVAFAPDGRTLASTGVGKDFYPYITLWDAATTKRKASLTGHGKGAVYRVAFAPDGKTLASCGWD